MAGVVLDTGAGAQFAEHLQVVAGSLLQTLHLEQTVLALQNRQVLAEFFADRCDRPPHPLLRRHVVVARKDRDPVHRLEDPAADRIEAADPVDLVAEVLDPDAAVVVGGENLEHVAPHPEAAVEEIETGAFVLHLGQAPLGPFERQFDPALEELEHRKEDVRRAKTVDAGDGSHDHHVAALEQGDRGPQPQAVDLVVDARFLLDVGVGLGDVGLGLVVVVVGDEVLHRVVREEAPELLVELGSQRLVVREDERRPVHGLDHLGNRVGLARTRDAEQHLFGGAGPDSVGKFSDRRRLIALRAERRHQLETSGAPGVGRALGPGIGGPPQVSLPDRMPRCSRGAPSGGAGRPRRRGPARAFGARR